MLAHIRRFALPALLLLASLPALAHAQGKVGDDSLSRTKRYRKDVAYGVALGTVYAGVDQLRNDPPEWGKGWPGYGKRFASDVGEFVIQESVTDAIAAVMDRPLDYQLCHCHSTAHRIQWALQGALFDPTPDRKHVLAVPRIVGAYAGSFAQASWRPNTPSGRTRTALVNGTVSLLIGAGINLWHEARGR